MLCCPPGLSAVLLGHLKSSLEVLLFSPQHPLTRPLTRGTPGWCLSLPCGTHSSCRSGWRGMFLGGFLKTLTMKSRSQPLSVCAALAGSRAVLRPRGGGPSPEASTLSRVGPVVGSGLGLFGASVKGRACCFPRRGAQDLRRPVSPPAGAALSPPPRLVLQGQEPCPCGCHPGCARN